MTSHLQQAIAKAADHLEAACRADNREFMTTPRPRAELGDPAYKDPYVNGANMLHNAAYLVEEEEKLIVTLAKELLENDMSKERRRELESMIGVYS